jgi:hypothetical protein
MFFAAMATLLLLVRRALYWMSFVLLLRVDNLVMSRL